MKEYYADRLRWIFTYRKKSIGYILAKTLCLLFGVPLYAALFVVEMALTFINMLFSIVPILNLVVVFICKMLLFVCDLGFYLCILTDLKDFKALHVRQEQCAEENLNYEGVDDGDCDAEDEIKDAEDGDKLE